MIDECGFEEGVAGLYAWSKRGKNENLIAARSKDKKDLIAPLLFTGRLDAEGLEGGFSLFLLANVTPPSVSILDNAPIHRKTKIKELAKEAGHQILFLPSYSPSLNDIEHDFSVLKKARIYSESGTYLDNILRLLCLLMSRC